MNLDRKKNHYNDVSLLVTHYNRSKSLERLLDRFNDLDSSFAEIVVSDDGSKPEHLDYIKKLQETHNFKLVTSPVNKGLGSNINKGQDAVTTAYTLYVQEDFVPLNSFDTSFKNAVEIISQDTAVDTIRFYGYVEYPKSKPYKHNFSEMIFDRWSLNIKKTTMYSDHPHLRRSDFLKKFGRYPENKNPEKTEYDMMVSFLKNKGKALVYNDYKTVFDQVNTSTEPSTMNRKFWRYSDNYLLSATVYCYR
ncbi:MAG: glycosyltransferase family 2 protein, partial [Pedobacter sp.]